ncbi:MAG: hypothetical protein CVT48_01105 [Thermoplasmata archaeon HGW-Thermoplasmata-1]|nr:MAG: hypothetical protein CVT48_01105 [Thermoplasmata archaeon HGW-Thermoplasmata-1]
MDFKDASFNFLQDPATIPQVLGPYIIPVYVVAYTVAPLLLAMAVVTEMSKTLREDDPPKYLNIAFRAVGVMLGLTMYRTLFLAVVSICQVLSYYMFSMDKWSEMQTVLKQAQEKSFFDFMKLSPNDLIVSLLSVLTQTIEHIFNIIRYMLLALFYVFGPIVFATTLWPGKEKALTGWFKNLFIVSAWILVLRALQGTFVAILFAAQIIPDGGIGDLKLTDVNFIVLTTTYIILIIATPSLTDILLSGEGLGHLGSAVMAGVSGVAGKIMSAGGGAAKLAGGLSKIPGLGKIGAVQKFADKMGALNREISPPMGSKRVRTAPKVKSGDEQ